LVNINNGIATTTSLIIAEQFGRAHKSVLNSLDKFKGRHGIVPSSYLAGNGKQEKCYILNERQALIAMPFIGGEKSEDGQVALVDAFLELRQKVNYLMIRSHQIDVADQYFTALKKLNKINSVKDRIELYSVLDSMEWCVLYAIEFAKSEGITESELIKNNADYQKMTVKKSFLFAD
jgi:phage regulator Rha-like protein